MSVYASATLTIGQFFALVGIVVVGMLLAGGVVIAGRKWLGGQTSGAEGGDDSNAGPAGSLIRSWIAIALVMGLLVFCAASLWVPDATIRSTMFGGLIASVSAAVAYYFSSQGADKARSDLLQAALPPAQKFAPTTFSGPPPPSPVPRGQRYPAYAFNANGQPAPEYSLAPGSRPPTGLDVGSDGAVTGTPTEPGQWQFTVRAANVAGHVDQDVTITVT